MNTKKLVARSDFLLPQSLEDFHFQSREWLETLAFWKDEIRFFQILLKQRGEFVQDLSDFPGLLGNLDTLHQNLFDYLTEEILAHERLLSRAVKGEKGISDADYRDTHRKLGTKMQVFGADFRKFKKMVYGYARKW